MFKRYAVALSVLAVAVLTGAGSASAASLVAAPAAHPTPVAPGLLDDIGDVVSDLLEGVEDVVQGV